MKNDKIKNLKKRHRKEFRFKAFGMISIAFSLALIFKGDSPNIQLLEQVITCLCSL